MESAIGGGVVRLHPIRIDDLDGFGILYHARYVAIVDHAISDWWFAAGWDLHGPSQPVVRSIAVDYSVPIAATGDVEVHFGIVGRGTTSVRYGFEIRRGDVVHASGTRTNVFIDRTDIPTSISNEVWALAEPLMLSEDETRPERPVRGDRPTS